MIHVESLVELSVAPDLVKEAARATLTHQSVHGDLTVVLTDDAQLYRLNSDYLGVDAPTDVLSFPASEPDPETGARYLGDILISIPRAAQQAEAAGHPLESEVCLLVVHGVLHLLGYDHADPQEKAEMWSTQAEILKILGLADLEIREE